jgi:hypothetical protein
MHALAPLVQDHERVRGHENGSRVTCSLYSFLNPYENFIPFNLHRVVLQGPWGMITGGIRKADSCLVGPPYDMTVPEIELGVVHRTGQGCSV